MKKDRAQVTRKQWAPRQFVEAASALLRRQGELKASRAAPTRKRRQASPATIPARSTSVAFRTRVAALTLVLLLCAVMGAVEAIATTYAAPSNPLAAKAPAHRPTGTPWGRRTPTPPASPSPTFTTTPSETPGSQPSGSATTRPAVPVPATTPHALQQPRENQMRVPLSSGVATSPTDSNEQPSQDRPGGVLPLLALVMAILGSSACAVCLLALGLRRLRKHRVSLKAKQLISPTARSWQRVRPGSLDGETGIAGSGRAQTLPSPADCAQESSVAERTTEPSLPVVRDVPLSLSGFSLTTSQPTLATVQPQASARPFTGPTSSEALTSHIWATPKANGSIPGIRLRTAMRKRREDRDAENVPFLTDPGGEEALEEYIRKGRLAWQSRGGGQVRG
jgi:hypothetical protein